jgi:prepilin-type N-terminal cleavage/methylation domain-containing protein
MKRAFTLIELLIVIVIIGILVIIAIPQYQKIIARSESAEAITNLSAQVKSQRIYYTQYSAYLSIAWADANKTTKFETLGLDNPDTARWTYGAGAPYGGAGFWAPCVRRVGGPYNSSLIWYNIDTNVLHTRESNPYPGIEAVADGVK